MRRGNRASRSGFWLAVSNPPPWQTDSPIEVVNVLPGGQTSRLGNSTAISNAATATTPAAASSSPLELTPPSIHRLTRNRKEPMSLEDILMKLRSPEPAASPIDRLQQLVAMRGTPQPSGGLDVLARAQAPLGRGGTPEENIALARAMAQRKYGWDRDELRALVELGGRESGWRQDAENPSSGAYGIPQALPATKMNAKAQAGDPRAQIAWMLRYIKERYGSPSAALAHHDRANWY